MEIEKALERWEEVAAKVARTFDPSRKNYRSFVDVDMMLGDIEDAICDLIEAYARVECDVE